MKNSTRPWFERVDRRSATIGRLDRKRWPRAVFESRLDSIAFLISGLHLLVLRVEVQITERSGQMLRHIEASFPAGDESILSQEQAEAGCRLKPYPTV